MPKSEQNIYRIARCLARVSKEQAVEELAISSTTLRAYEENRRNVPDDVVVRMATLYRYPWLLVQHLQRSPVFIAAFGEVHCNIENKAVNVLAMQETVKRFVNETIPALIESTLSDKPISTADICREVIKSLLPFANENAASAGTLTAEKVTR